MNYIIELMIFGPDHPSYGKIGSSIDTRMPITLAVLRTILHHTPIMCPSEYREYLFKAMCTTAFFAFLRVGEITACSRSPAVLQLNQVVQFVEHFLSSASIMSPWLE